MKKNKENKMAKEVLEAPAHSDDIPEFGVDELSSIAGAEHLASEEERQQLQEKQTKQGKEKEEQPRQDEPTEPEQKEPARQEPDSQQQQPQQVQSEDTRIKDLENQLEFYKTLYGDNAQPVQYQPQQQQQVVPQQVQQQQPQPQAQNPFDLIQIDANKLQDFYSGDPAKVLPVVREFVATAVAIAQHQWRQEQVQSSNAINYVNKVQEILYAKYDDLKDLRPLVKMAGDQIDQEYRSKGINKLPHQIIDEVGQRARQLRQQLVGTGNSNPTAPRQVVKQGEVGNTKITPPTPEKLTKQQKEMYDLFPDNS